MSELCAGSWRSLKQLELSDTGLTAQVCVHECMNTKGKWVGVVSGMRQKQESVTCKQ